MARTEYVCRVCRHGFPWFSGDGPKARCPRCGRGDLEDVPWLLLTLGTEGLTDEDHYEALLAV